MSWCPSVTLKSRISFFSPNPMVPCRIHAFFFWIWRMTRDSPGRPGGRRRANKNKIIPKLVNHIFSGRPEIGQLFFFCIRPKIIYLCTQRDTRPKVILQKRNSDSSFFFFFDCFEIFRFHFQFNQLISTAADRKQNNQSNNFKVNTSIWLAETSAL